MRIRDIGPVREEVTSVSFVRTAPDSWEIHFRLGGGAQDHAITMHWPDEVRVWKSLEGAFREAEKIFDLKQYTIIINEKEQQQ
ncbi:MAG TPA: hypothetical protein VEC35_09560 [Noviherbaspirillum sp.]|nr:hypothetical protein [Noviherbaspirillum sp.]